MPDASDDICTAVKTVKRGGIIAYPTEAVYGLGCDPINHKSLERLANIKGRDTTKGFIIVAASLEQLEPFIQPIDEDSLKQRVLNDWPGPVTWILPARENLSPLLTGSRDTIAVRVSDHDIVRSLCVKLQGAIVSTSANVSGKTELRTSEEVESHFGASLDFIVGGYVGGNAKPTSIFDGGTLKQIR